jgi:poly(hydroxyalkanoate) depolymerase family esterase
MLWSPELKLAGRSLRTALRAASAMLQPLPAPAVLESRPGDLQRIAAFGANPGGLSMLAYVPPALPPASPVVVLLHGCGQDPARFAEEGGWVSLADRLGLALILPEQSDANNRYRCFNWFRPVQAMRGQGEAQSIRSMTATAVRRLHADRRHIYVAGLSAGAAMTAVMLASYPDVFAAGAAVAGLPVGAASGGASALARMARAGPEGRTAEEWADQARHVGPRGYRGDWPRLSIWHGQLDPVVDPANGDLMAQQWRALHGLAQAPATASEHLGLRHLAWGNRRHPAVELRMLTTLRHGYPTDMEGDPAAYILPAGISATNEIARFWALTRG